MPPGQKAGHGAAEGSGLDWGRYVAELVVVQGSLAAVAEALAASRGHKESVESIARALRRLRQKGHDAGGVWGQRCLKRFGLPGSVASRIRWMGQYHSRFTDLPAEICAELLRPWDRPPVSESRAWVWVALGWTSLALRRRDREAARVHLGAALALGPRAGATAAAECGLVAAFIDGPHAVGPHLDRVAHLLDDPSISAHDRACLHARLVDQQAYPLNRPEKGGAPNHEAALRLYESLPDDAPPFARCRKANGMAWTLHKLGRREAAVHWARRSVQDAGDAGSLRMRAMALNALAALQPPHEAQQTRRRRDQIHSYLRGSGSPISDFPGSDG